MSQPHHQFQHIHISLKRKELCESQNDSQCRESFLFVFQEIDLYEETIAFFNTNNINVICDCCGWYIEPRYRNIVKRFCEANGITCQDLLEQASSFEQLRQDVRQRRIDLILLMFQKKLVSNIFVLIKELDQLINFNLN